MAFVEYRDYERTTGERRSLHKLAKRLHKSHALVARWQARHSWLARVGAWDGHLDALTATAAEEQARKDGASLMAETLVMRKSVSIPIAALLKRLQEDKTIVERMPIAELVSLLPRLAAALAAIGGFERLLRGESTANAAVVVSSDIEMQEAPTDEGYLRRFVMAAIEAGIVDGDDDSDGGGSASTNGTAGDAPQPGILPARTDGETAPFSDA